jgi:hypothetical protein
MIDYEELSDNEINELVATPEMYTEAKQQLK